MIDARRFVAYTLLALSLASTTARSQAPELPRVLGPDAQSQPQTRTHDTATVRSRTVQPDVVLLDAIARRHLRTSEATRFVVDLFPGLEVTAEVVAAEVRPGGTTLFAKLRDVEAGSAVFTLEAGVLSATIDMPQGNYMVTPRGDGTHQVASKSAALYPDEAMPRQPFSRAQPADPFGTAQAAPDVPADSGRLIDVMIVWTPAAEAAAGGLAAMQNLAQSSIDSANGIYLNSGIAQRLRLVHRQQVAYTERSNCSGGNAFDCGLDDITGNGDGYMDTVHTLRNTHGADMVALLISDATYCGLAWFLSTTAGDPSHAFSVTDQGCAVGNRSFAHELGHNMGADHDPANAFSAPAAYPYNRGYIKPGPGPQWRTVMAYAAPCGGCPRIAHMSNPKDLYAGAVTGSAGVSNNAHVLNKTAKAIANYRATSILHPVPQRFADVPTSHGFYGHIEFFAQAGISTGCTAGAFCPDQPVSRRQMAAFLERPIRSTFWVPPTTTTAFSDVIAGSQFAGHIEALRTDGITTGCGPSVYCPEQSVTRAQMAVFVLRARCGSGYVPNMPVSQTFADVPLSHQFVRYIQKMYSLGITGGCATGPLRYCPDDPVTRGQMAAFIERAYPFLAPSEVCSL